MLTVIGLITFSGCKKDPVIDYPITLTYQNSTNDSGVKAYEKQGNQLVEISAAPYEAEPEFAISTVDKFERIVLLSKSTAELYLGSSTYEANYSMIDNDFKFSYTEPTLQVDVTHTASGDESKLNSHGIIVELIDGAGSVFLSGICGELDGEEVLPCLSGDAVTGAYSSDLDDGEILVLRTFDFVYE